MPIVLGRSGDLVGTLPFVGTRDHSGVHIESHFCQPRGTRLITRLRNPPLYLEGLPKLREDFYDRIRGIFKFLQGAQIHERPSIFHSFLRLPFFIFLQTLPNAKFGDPTDQR